MQFFYCLYHTNLNIFCSINLCSQAARILNQFMNKKTELNGMEAYKQQIDLLQKVSGNFVDKLNSHIAALFDNIVE